MKSIYKKYHIQLFSLMVVSAILTACQSDGVYVPDLTSDASISFRARLLDENQIKTRMLDTLYVTSTPFSGNFYIEMNSVDPETGAESSTIGTYRVPSGYEGVLQPVDDANALSWQTLEGAHTFYSWTMPWYDGYVADSSTEPDSNFDSSLWTDATEVTTDPVTIYFHDSPEGPEYNQYKNNAIYETFIGSTSGPYSYIGHGKYVDFTFRHLVSKINVDMLALVKTDNSINKDAVGDITFMGLPSEATFYAHPDDGSAPYVAAPAQLNPDSGVTFFINNAPGNEASGTKNEFYICPEIDFSQIGFKINLNNAEYGNEGDYFGSFNDVEFIRVSGEDFDIGDGTDDKVLHAGEMMTLNFMLVPGVGPGVSVIIQDWSTESQRSAVNHPYQGIYTDEEMQELIELFAKYNPANYPNGQIPEEIMEYFELYGIVNDEGEMVFPLYDDVHISTSVCSIFKGFIVDGRGHKLIMRTNSNQTFGGTPYYNIGPVRDIYITDDNGNNAIYIDSDGYVFIFDEETQDFVKTDNQLGELDYTANGQPAYSYDINPKTGEIIKSNFYSF